MRPLGSCGRWFTVRTSARDWVLSFDIGLPSDRIDMKLPLENLMANGRSTSELDSQRQFLWKRLRPGAHHG